MQGKKKKRRNTVLMVILGIVAAGCLIYAGYFFWQVRLEQQEFEEYKEEYIVEDTDDETESGHVLLDIDWDGLLAQNPDVVGWIEMATGCSYPIVQSDDNDYYLHRSLSREYSYSGCIFMSYQCASDWSDRNTIVYGHNMRNGTMFGLNNRYRNKSYAVENSYFWIYVPDGSCYEYKVFSVMEVDDATRTYDVNIFSDQDLQTYLEDISENKLYDLDAEVGEGDRIVTLSTCASHNSIRRLVIQGVMEKVYK